MELIKKHNYEDPLHMKGDPFGAADAKVAHVNQLITEVNSQTTSVDSLTSRVETLENAPAPTSEYYVNGRILQYDDGSGNPLFLFNVDSHNTPLTNTIDSFGHNTFQGLFQLASSNVGTYSLYTNFPILQIETTDGNVSAYFNYYTMTSCVITPTDQLYDSFAGANKALIGISVDNLDFTQGNSDLGTFAVLKMKTARYNNTNLALDLADSDIPTNAQNEFNARNILSVQIRFSSLIFTPVE
jgi:hypothetical protein